MDLENRSETGRGPVQRYGALRVLGNKIVSDSGVPIQLRGMSLHWSQWSDFFTPATVDTLIYDWNVTVVRAPLGVEKGGYLEDKNKNRDKIICVVEQALKRGLYVIIDWHDHNAHNHLVDSKAFFGEMARTYGEYPNVLFEIYNEPESAKWPEIKKYAEEIIDTIRLADSPNIVIVGTPTWSQDVDVAAYDPIKLPNVAYSLHFYSETHRQSNRDKAIRALGLGAALFVTEWGTTNHEGKGNVNLEESRLWLELLNRNSIGWTNWSLANFDDPCSALLKSAKTVGPWPDSELSPSGRFVKTQIS